MAMDEDDSDADIIEPRTVRARLICEGTPQKANMRINQGPLYIAMVLASQTRAVVGHISAAVDNKAALQQTHAILNRVAKLRAYCRDDFLTEWTFYVVSPMHRDRLRDICLRFGEENGFPAAEQFRYTPDRSGRGAFYAESLSLFGSARAPVLRYGSSLDITRGRWVGMKRHRRFFKLAFDKFAVPGSIRTLLEWNELFTHKEFIDGECVLGLDEIYRRRVESIVLDWWYEAFSEWRVCCCFAIGSSVIRSSLSAFNAYMRVASDRFDCMLRPLKVSTP
jgi:hypothetical protein